MKQVLYEKWKSFYYDCIKMLFSLYLQFIVCIVLMLTTIATGSDVIGITAFLFAVFYVIELNVYNHNQRRQRINSFFVAKRLPFSKWHNIYQLTDKTLLKRHSSCTQLYPLLRKEICSMFWNGLKKGYYQTVTHEVIIRRIRYMQKIGMLRIIQEEKICDKSLIRVQDQLLKGRCKGCTEKSTCPYQTRSTHTTAFYYISFEVNYNYKGKQKAVLDVTQ